ncbi:MAG: tRNA pseudouridine(38-40) synthase TruA [Gammaproteobacteria bacterium]
MRIALGIEYDGSAYCGWQRQAEGMTVQGRVEAGLSTVADHPVSVVCAGRTDTGVHAMTQVVHFDTDAHRSDANWVRGANANLPHDVRVQWSARVDEHFHARFSARRRSYRYIILNRPVASAILRQRVCHEYRPLDHVRMQAAACALVGEHDFTSFRAAGCQAKSPRREIYRLDVTRSRDCVYIDVEANAFLHHMVRCIAGVLLAIGRGEQPVDWAVELLEARDRTLSGVNAPPGGLYLVNVMYDPAWQLPAEPRLPVFG